MLRFFRTHYPGLLNKKEKRPSPQSSPHVLPAQLLGRRLSGTFEITSTRFDRPDSGAGGTERPRARLCITTSTQEAQIVAMRKAHHGVLPASLYKFSLLCCEVGPWVITNELPATYLALPANLSKETELGVSVNRTWESQKNNRADELLHLY